MNSLRDFTAISIGTIVAEAATAPICTVKTVYQNSIAVGGQKTVVNHKVNDIIKQIYHGNGIAGFYRSTFSAIGSQLISSGSKFVLYEHLKKRTNHPITAGLLTGILSSFFTHPIDAIKVHRQMNDPIIPKIKTLGLHFFWRGYSKTLLKYSVGSVCFLPIKDMLTPKYGVLVASFLSAIISTTITQPFDYMKTRQIYGNSVNAGYNPLQYYKGLSLNLARVVPHFTITMVVVDMVSKFINARI